MILPWTIWIYIFTLIIRSFLIIGGGFYTLIFVLDFLELINRTSDLSLSFIQLLKLELLKIPDTVDNSLLYIFLFSCTHCIYQFNKSKELTAVKCSGLSTRQILTPIVFFALLISVFQVTFLNHLGIVSYREFIQTWNKHRNIEGTTINLSQAGLWLRERTKNGYRVINGETFNNNTGNISNTYIFELNHKNALIGTYIAKEMYLKKTKWSMHNVTFISTNNTKKHYHALSLPTELSITSLKNSFKSVHGTSFWELRDHIDHLKKADLDSREFEYKLHHMLSLPLIYIGIVCIVFYFCGMHLGRNPNKKNIIKCIATGFFIFFYLSLIPAIIQTTPIPAFVVGWLTSIAVFLLGLAMLLSVEKVYK